MRDLRWDCAVKGCFRQMCPKLGAFDPCFPGKIGMSDVDGIVEIAGHFLMLEWKAQGGSVTTGQRIMFERLTALSPHLTVIVVSGHPRELTIKSVQVFHGGAAAAPETCDFDGLMARVHRWSERAQRLGPSSRRKEAE